MIRGTEIGRALGAVIAVSVFAFVVGLLVVFCAGCRPPLTEAQEDEVKAHSADLALCQAQGHLAHKLTGDPDAGWSVYYACTVDGGLR